MGFQCPPRVTQRNLETCSILNKNTLSWLHQSQGLLGISTHLARHLLLPPPPWKLNPKPEEYVVRSSSSFQYSMNVQEEHGPRKQQKWQSVCAGQVCGEGRKGKEAAAATVYRS